MAGNITTNFGNLKGCENYEEWAFAAENYITLEGMDS